MDSRVFQIKLWRVVGFIILIFISILLLPGIIIFTPFYAAATVLMAAALLISSYAYNLGKVYYPDDEVIPNLSAILNIFKSTKEIHRLGEADSTRKTGRNNALNFIFWLFIFAVLLCIVIFLLGLAYAYSAVFNMELEGALFYDQLENFYTLGQTIREFLLGWII